MKHASTIHTFLFALFVPVALYARNSNEIPVSDILLPVALILALNGSMQLLITATRRDRGRLNIMMSVFWLAFFLLMPTVEATGLRIRYVVMFFGVILAGALSVALRASPASIWRTTQAMSLTATLLVVSPVFILLRESWRALTDSELPGVSVQSIAAPNSPDIYYVILDGYTGSRTLQRFFAYDNSAFEAYLRSRGFSIAAHSRSNYPSTINSLATSLNMEYVTGWPERDPVRLRRRIYNARVFRELKDRGYRTVFLTMTSHLRTDAPAPLIDEQLSFGGISGLPQYQMTLLSMAPIRLALAIADRTPLRHLGGRMDADGKLWEPEGVDWVLSRMTEPRDSSGPLFMFVHVLSPHSPYYHDAECRLITDYARQSWNNFNRDFTEYRQAYVGQLQCLNTKMMAALEKLLAAGRNPVVILQADHGAPEIMDSALRRHDPTLAAEFRFSILNAYRVPERVRHRLYDGISPVNSFRVLLSELFGVPVGELLPDVSYWTSGDEHVPVTGPQSMPFATSDTVLDRSPVAPRVRE